MSHEQGIPNIFTFNLQSYHRSLALPHVALYYKELTIENLETLQGHILH